MGIKSYGWLKYRSLFLLIAGCTLIMTSCGDTEITVEDDVSITGASLETTAQVAFTPALVSPTPTSTQATPATATSVVTRVATVQVATVPAIMTQTPTPTTPTPFWRAFSIAISIAKRPET